MDKNNVQMTDKTCDSAGHSDIVSIPEAALKLNKSERTIRRMISAGKLNIVDISGRQYVQLAGLDSMPDMDKKSVQVSKSVQDMDKNNVQVSQGFADILQDTIKRQDSEISFLRNELTAVRTTLDTITRMLPAPKNNTQQPGLQLWIILLIVVVILAAAAGGYLLWLR